MVQARTKIAIDH